MTTSTNQPQQYLAIYLPEFEGISAQTVPITASSSAEILQKTHDARPSGKRLSRIVRADNPGRNLWEAGKGWIPQTTDEHGRDWY